MEIMDFESGTVLASMLRNTFLASKTKNYNILVNLLDYQLDYVMRYYPNKMKHYIGLIHDSDGSLNYVPGKVYLKRIDKFSNEELRYFLQVWNIFFSLGDYLLLSASLN